MLDRLSSRLVPGLALLGVAGACSTAYHERRVDEDVERLLTDRTQVTLGQREESVLYPEPLAPVDTVPTEEPEVLVLSLRGALEVGVQSNRDYKTRLEDLTLSALDLINAGWTFSPQLNAVLGYLYADSEGQGADQINETSYRFDVSQLLRWGTELSLSASSLRSNSRYDPSVSIRLIQPLLRGGGTLVTREPLVQAERSMIYEIRAFELFRQDFSIDVASGYYSLVQSLQSIENQRENMADFTFARRQAEAFFNVGRAKELDVLRARRQELNSENALIAEIESYQLELDRFRIFLGLDRGVRLEIESEAPDFVPVDYGPDSAVEVALANRLDVLTRRERLQDLARGVRIAENGLLPDLDLSLDYNFRDPDLASSFGSQDLGQEDYGASVTLGLPLNRVRERNSYRAARIAHTRGLRAYDQFEDNVTVEVRSSIRELVRRRRSVEIQQEQIGTEEKNVRISEIQFERGEVNNRDVVEAQLSLLAARNRLINEQVNYEIARLQLLRDLGVLFIDPEGMWKP